LIDKQILRVIDVNVNRAKEGIRVCEDIARFILKDNSSAMALKAFRHGIQRIISNSKIQKKLLLAARDIESDRCKVFSSLEKKDKWQSVFFANIQRVKESLRVLEEFFKLFDEKTGIKFKSLRFKFYNQEKHLIERHF